MRKVYILAKNTFRESIRSKILYSIVLFAILVVVASSIFGLVTIGDKVKVLKDFGLFALNLFGVAYVVITGSALLFKELSRKTIFNILAKPIRRSEFIWGKFLGMLMTLFLMLGMMSLALMVFLYFYSTKVDYNLMLASYSVFLQVMMVCSLVILLSSIFVTPFLSGAITFGLFLIGRSSEVILQLIESFKLQGISEYIFKTIYYLLPNLAAVDISNKVVHNFPVPAEVLIWNSVYAIGYAALAIILASHFFSRREFN